MGNILEQLQEVVRAGGQSAPVSKLLGFRLTHIEAGSATVEIEVNERFWNPMGTLHGGILVDIADAAVIHGLMINLVSSNNFAAPAGICFTTRSYPR